MKLEVEVPEELKEELPFLQQRLNELIELELKRKVLIRLFDELMKGAEQLSDEELVELGRKIKQGRFEELSRFATLKILASKSKLTKQDAIELGRLLKKSRAEKLRE